MNNSLIRIKYSPIVRGIHRIFTIYKHYIVRKKSFMHYGERCNINPPFDIVPSNIWIGDDTHIGRNSVISAVNAKFICKGHCAIAHNLTVHTGNHARVKGLFITDINENNKPEGFDKDVVIEEDCWIGCNVILLSGITIGRGVTIAAGAVVNKSIPPYCIAGGVPAKVIKYYWSTDEIIEHEKKIYNEADRYSRDYLEKMRK